MKRMRGKGPLIFNVKRVYTEAGWWDKPHFNVHAYDPILCQSHQCESLIIMADNALNKALEKAFHDAVRLCVFRLTGNSVSRSFIRKNFKDWLYGYYDESDTL